MESINCAEVLLEIKMAITIKNLEKCFCMLFWYEETKYTKTSMSWNLKLTT
jgi:hypothetical protein